MPEPAIKRGYAELHAWSNFSFLQGGSHPEELIDRAAELELSAIALTDRDGLYGAVRFAAHARQCRVNAIIGSELTFEDGAHLVLLVENQCGYANLCRLISAAQMRGGKGDARLRIEDLEVYNEGLIALSGGLYGRVERALAGPGVRVAVEEAQRLASIFSDRFYLELQQHLISEETQRNLQLVRIAGRCRLPYVATNAVVYATGDDALVADVLACVRDGTTIAQARAANKLRPNAEFHLKPPAAMRRLFAEHPQAIAGTVEIARALHF